MKPFIVIIILTVGLAGIGEPAAAQPPTPPSDRHSGMVPNWRGGTNPENRLEMLRIWKLSEFLGLDQKQATQFFPALQSHRETMRGIDSSIVVLHKSIFDQVNQKEVSQAQVNVWRAKLLDLQHQKSVQEQSFLKSLPQYLTPEQQAKYLVFEWRFQQMLRNAIRERGRWPGQPNTSHNNNR